jgi:hypothetical protein
MKRALLAVLAAGLLWAAPAQALPFDRGVAAIDRYERHLVRTTRVDSFERGPCRRLNRRTIQCRVTEYSSTMFFAEFTYWPRATWRNGRIVIWNPSWTT